MCTQCNAKNAWQQGGVDRSRSRIQGSGAGWQHSGRLVPWMHDGNEQTAKHCKRPAQMLATIVHGTLPPW